MFKGLGNDIGKILVKNSIEELIGQGHKASGKLIRSVAYAVKVFSDLVIVEQNFIKYGQYLDTGIPASRWKKPPGRAVINQLIKWIKQKGIRPNRGDVKGFAWAISKSRPKIGYPSPNSRQFSPNGRILNWLDFTIQASLTQIVNITDQTVGDEIEIVIENSVKKLII